MSGDLYHQAAEQIIKMQGRKWKILPDGPEILVMDDEVGNLYTLSDIMVGDMVVKLYKEDPVTHLVDKVKRDGIVRRFTTFIPY